MVTQQTDDSLAFPTPYFLPKPCLPLALWKDWSDILTLGVLLTLGGHTGTVKDERKAVLSYQHLVNSRFLRHL